jgi:hypothetical protein
LFLACGIRPLFFEEKRNTALCAAAAGRLSAAGTAATACASAAALPARSGGGRLLRQQGANGADGDCQFQCGQDNSATHIKASVFDTDLRASIDAFRILRK